jgi:hypothetical protein
MTISEEQLGAIWAAVARPASVGHAHFWERALSRRQFLGAAVAVGGAAAMSGLPMPSVAEAAAPGPGTPRPIPGTVAPGAPFHVILPGAGNEPSTITDFNGFSGIVDITGVGTGTGTDLTFGADMRFMSGIFRGTDGRVHRGTFGFV